MSKSGASEARLLIVGNNGGTNVGGSFFRAGRNLEIETQLIEMSAAMDAPKWRRRFNWWVRGKRPTWLVAFSNRVVRAVEQTRPCWLLATGTAPLCSEALDEIGRLGVKRINYLTDDPFNPAHKAAWFLKSLPKYDFIFSPRRANLDDLKRLDHPEVCYLPFAYDEEMFFPEAPAPGEEHAFSSELMFAGGADRDRVPYFSTLGAAGVDVALYGDYWDRYSETREMYRGYADPRKLRKAISGTQVALCLVRRANRDGHCMRTFEVPAVGACLLVEDTEEHREIFGADEEAAVFFSSKAEMVEKIRWLKERGDVRQRLAKSSHQLIAGGKNTYRDRLSNILAAVK